MSHISRALFFAISLALGLAQVGPVSAGCRISRAIIQKRHAAALTDQVDECY